MEAPAEIANPSAAPADGSALAPQAPLPVPGPMILVVDDSRTMRESLAAILADEGYRVGKAADGKEGFAQAKALSPDLILSDLEMPIANGFELLSMVRSDPDLTMVPFVMITGVSDRSSTRRAMELGADDYLTKPFTLTEVAALVHSRMQKQRNWRQATRALAQRYSQSMMTVLPHEFRTPLNSILGFAELMGLRARNGLSPEQTKEFAEVIQRAGKTLLSHTTRFLTLMEYQGAPDFHPAYPGPSTPCNEGWIKPIVDEVLAAQLPASRVQATVDVEDAVLRGREDLLRNIVKELAGNGVKFASPDTLVHITGQKQGAGYQLRVANVGVTFPLDRMNEVGAFVQFDRDRMEQQGLGIGLAIVSNALRQIDGRMEIQNLPDRAVAVTVNLKLA